LGTITKTSLIRSGGTLARMTFAARVARKVTSGPSALTVNRSTPPGGVPAMKRFAVVIARTSSSDRKGSCRFHAIAEPASIASVRATVTTAASARRGISRRHRRTIPSAARIGIANPNVTKRSAGSHPVARANTTPAAVRTNHERRIRPALPPGIVNPRIASGTDTHWT